MGVVVHEATTPAGPDIRLGRPDPLSRLVGGVRIAFGVIRPVRMLSSTYLDVVWEPDWARVDGVTPKPSHRDLPWPLLPGTRIMQRNGTSNN